MNPFEYMQPAMGEDRHAIPASDHVLSEAAFGG